MFSIRKGKYGGTSVSRGGYGLSIVFMIIGGGGFLFLLYSLLEGSYTFQDGLAVPLIFSLLFFVVGFLFFRSELKRKKAKKFKNNGNGIIKRLPVSNIGYYHDSGDEDTNGFSGYYLEIRDGDMIYCSDGFEKARKEGLPLKFFEKTYREYGFEYDEKHKQDVLRKIDEKIAEKGYEAENAWFLKKWFIKHFTGAMIEKIREYIEKGYEPEKMIVNGHTVSVGDLVDIYVDPDCPEDYWVDVDFLMEK